MQRQSAWCRIVGLGFLVLAALQPARANNLAVANVAVTPRDATTAVVEFDISWDNSWRYDTVNHDAAWVFFKAQPQGETYWTNVVLEYSGVNPTGCSTGQGTAVELVVPTDKVGLFVRRAGEGSGAVAVANVKVVWNFAASGFVNTSMVKMRALAVEMVYVAQGDFAAGSGGSEWGAFTLTTINTATANTVPSGSGSLGGQAGGYPTGQTAPNASWPNGYNAFYCMKYETTQGQYKDFLNTLTRVQQATRCAATTLNYYMVKDPPGSATIQKRNTVRLTTDPSPDPREYTTVTPDRACNWLSYMDSAAFADWAGLRPMTELEFEKACRGPLAPVATEYAWGTTSINGITGLNNDGTGTDTVTGGNCNGHIPPLYESGPLRVGIFATAGSTREQAGASYWGIMELSGNVAETPVTIGVADGRIFTGLHGDGNLSANGNANVAAWPGLVIGEVTATSGRGWRGVNSAATSMRVSDRQYAAGNYEGVRDTHMGWRGVRSAP